MKFSAKEIKKSKSEAFQKIKEYLDAEDVAGQFNDRNGDYHSKDKFIVTWIGNWKGIPAEYSIDKTDSFYASYSGSKAIYATRSLIHEKQLGSYGSIELALIKVGVTLCPANEKQEFWSKYAVKYNERITKLNTENAV